MAKLEAFARGSQTQLVRIAIPYQQSSTMTGWANLESSAFVCQRAKRSTKSH